MIAAIAIFGARPLPSSRTRIGALATTGIELISTVIGKNACSTLRLCTNTAAVTIAAKLPSTKPPIASIAVGARLLINRPNLSQTVRATTCGAGAIKGFT
jgi:hypothetical protein